MYVHIILYVHTCFLYGGVDAFWRLIFGVGMNCRERFGEYEVRAGRLAIMYFKLCNLLFLRIVLDLQKSVCNACKFVMDRFELRNMEIRAVRGCWLIDPCASPLLWQ